MDELVFVVPELCHKKAAEEFKREFFDQGESVINGSALLDQMDYEDWCENTRRNRRPETARADWVSADTFFVFRKGDGKLVGVIDLRHDISGNEFLSAYGGHIGYSVRPSERRKGYAFQMLRMALAHEKVLGLSRVMLGCYCDNLASKRTIERCGGRLAETKPYLDGKPMDVYWIEL
ncbi:MAG: GNAT family N-acetyltransferase [Oscillospiraceae bacterium]|nr:GNAT family N-acetyltransferase [Oscillospiraceae bacterium]